MSGRNEEAITADVSPASTPPVLDADATALLTQPDAREQALDSRERSLKERERQSQRHAEELMDRETELEVAQSKLQRALADVASSQRQVAEADSSVEARARDVAQREVEASAGFAAKNRESLAELMKAHASLRAEVERLQADLDAARLRGIESLETRLAEERRARTAALDAELQADRTRHHVKLSAEGAAHDAALAEMRARFVEEQRAALEDLNRQRAQLQEKAAELHRGLGELRWKEEDLAGVRAGIERSIEERARDQVSSLERQLEALRDDHRRDRELVISLELQLSAAQALLARFGDNPAEIERRIAQQMQKIGALEKELLMRPSASDKELLVTLQEKERVWAAERERLVRESTQLKAEQSRWLTGVADLEQQRERREVAERRLDVLAGEMEKYRAEVDRMRALYERPEERAARVGALEEPWRTDFKRAEGAAPKELDWLNGIATACESSGMRFPKRLVHAFHTSLKAAELSPLTVLAGVSGTGKSELPRLYSRFGGLGFLSLAVQPNWDSPQSLFGFFNSVDNRFNATTVLRAMVQAQHSPDHETYKHGLADRLLLVLLDEMNLAHVEQYFSDLLSRLEQRRGESRGVTLDIDLGAGMPPYPLSLGRNVLWVGTMNEDETTKTLSDKVIDRSNLLYFPRPRTLHSRAKVTLAAESPLLAESAWREWLQLRSPFTPSELEPFRQGLEEINQRLEYVGRALGHRVWQSVEYYMANHPEVSDARARNDQEALQRTMRRAFEDQLVLKVMPKLRGIETTGESRRNCLDPIRKQLESANFGLGLSDDFEIACRVGHGAFVWNSARYLENAE
ncbi:hypothetical protein [Corallococcus aberystwythensis]|uniref:Chromosome partitioning protein ParA n=1 Tax=Corallococcus aberystwythensis TaxID=2316722 RepID=A0A3A8QL48_9BACT|nr:hypothetical protein [Corallococcus aberystwythensis]RKH69403.1 hypothetical protein D7W81_11065 [Corallococcus aberystwythensis]